MNSSFLNQLCRMEPGHGPVLIPSIYFYWDWDLDCLLAMPWSSWSWRKALTGFALWQDALWSWQMIITMEWEVFRMSGYTCALTAEIMIAISPGPLPDMQPQVINKWGKLLGFFFPSSILRCFIRMASERNCSIIFLPDADSWLPLHEFFSSAHCNLLFFCSDVSTAFHLAFLDINLISFSPFLTTVLSFLGFLGWPMCSFYNHPILFILIPNFTHSTTNIFWISFLKEFYSPFLCFNWQLSCWGHISFQLATSNSVLMSASIPFWPFMQTNLQFLELCLFLF